MSDEPWPLIGTWWLISRSRIRSPAQVERVKSPIGAGEVLTAVDIIMEFHAFSTPAKFVCNSQAVGYAVRARLIWLGAAVRIWRILYRCFLAVDGRRWVWRNNE